MKSETHLWNTCTSKLPVSRAQITTHFSGITFDTLSEHISSHSLSFWIILKTAADATHFSIPFTHNRTDMGLKYWKVNLRKVVLIPADVTKRFPSFQISLAQENACFNQIVDLMRGLDIVSVVYHINLHKKISQSFSLKTLNMELIHEKSKRGAFFQNCALES